MGIQPGAQIGAFKVLGLIGQGGMGKVYRARDGRLKRDVALKVLPDEVASHPERVARFQGEAEILATLTHQHIAAVYGLEESDGARALIMELVDGPTLADRLATGPMPLDEALPVARQLVEALDYAHEHGVLHRDLKPANIKVTPEGQVKVLDFGLAKALHPQVRGAPPGSPDDSPTVTSPAFTEAGTILGTAAYMAPEAGARTGIGQTRGHLGFRLRAVRDADGPPCVCRRDGVGHPGRGVEDRRRLDAPARIPSGNRAAAARALPGAGSAGAPPRYRRRGAVAARRRAHAGCCGSREPQESSVHADRRSNCRCLAHRLGLVALAPVRHRAAGRPPARRRPITDPPARRPERRGRDLRGREHRRIRWPGGSAEPARPLQACRREYDRHPGAAQSHVPGPLT